jgi:putative transposase
LTPIAQAVRVNRPYQEIATCYYNYVMARTMRKRLDHTTHFAGRFGAIYFITICCQRRGSNQLCRDETATVLANTARIYHERARWNLNLLLLMPDHLHALIGVDGQTSLAQLIRDYKRITAKIAGVRWQPNFFDHRLRHDESLTEKFAYICQNPVRAGLTLSEHDWPYIFIHSGVAAAGGVVADNLR